MTTAGALNSGLRALPRALDARFMSARMAESGLRGTVSSVDVVAETPGRRAVLRYTIASTAGAPAALIGKMYADAARARRSHAVLTAVHEAMVHRDGLCSPRPVALLDDLSMVVQEAVDGPTLDRVAPAGRDRVVQGAGRWLAALHESAIEPDRSVNPGSEARKAAERATRIAGCDVRLGAGSAALRQSLDAAGAFTPPSVSRPLHRDFHYEHVLMSGECVAVIDLDEVRIGEPAVDVAHFCAYLRLLSLREGGEVHGSGALENAFVSAYRAGVPYTLDERHRLHLANACLKIADQLLRGRGPAPVPSQSDRADQADAMLQEGRRCLAA